MSFNKKILLSGALKTAKVKSFGVSSMPSEWNEHVKNIKSEALSEAKKSLEPLNKVFESIQGEFETLVKEISERMPDIAITIVKRIWGGLTLESQQVEAIVLEILRDNAPKGECLEVLLSEGDYDLLSKMEDVLENRYPGIKFKKSETLSSGDCLIKSRFGLVDATIDTKLKQIRRELD